MNSNRGAVNGYRGFRGRSGRAFAPNFRAPSTRGRGRGRGAGGGDVPRPPSPPLGPRIYTLRAWEAFSSAQGDSDDDQKAEITGCECIASFNWVERKEPTIAIPGSPPAWTPLAVAHQLNQDEGEYYRDPNAARFPNHPMEPAVRALLAENEGLETKEIDLVACSSTLGNLSRFVRQVDKPFRFFVEIVGNTAFFIRHENSPTELIEGIYGYGHTFPEAYTTWNAEVGGSASHQRLLRYKFAGLDCILRFECDGYLKSEVESGDSALDEPNVKHKEENVDNLSSILQSAKMGLPNEDTGHSASGQALVIKKAGRMIPQRAVFDLKTRASWKSEADVLRDEMPRLWLAQVPRFILARHDRGVFHDITVKNVKDGVKQWELDHQIALKRLSWLIRKIISVAKAQDDGKLEVCCKIPDEIELRQQDTDDHNVLSSDLKLRWANTKSDSHLVKSNAPEHNRNTPQSRVPSDSESDPAADDRDYYGRGDENDSYGSSDESEPDYTACAANTCGYCGHCTY